MTAHGKCTFRAAAAGIALQFYDAAFPNTDGVPLMNTFTRRQALLAGLATWQCLPARAADARLPELLRKGGVVAAFRHALAPGTFDPPEFTLGNCATQRNLNDEGRAQARAIGAWFTARGLRPAQVRTSPWCRCVDTATLAFGSAQAWDALGSPSGKSPEARAAQLRELHTAMAAAARQSGRFEVWVTHMFVIADLTGENTSSGDGVLLAPGSDGGRMRVLARLDLL